MSPVGLRSSPNKPHRVLSDTPRWHILGLLRNPTGDKPPLHRVLPNTVFPTTVLRYGAVLGSRILYQATYSAGKNNNVSKVAMMMPPIIA